jgi:small subunit ribosomal protein S8e
VYLRYKSLKYIKKTIIRKIYKALPISEINMVVTQSKSKKLETGKPYKKARRKKLYEKGRNPTLTKIGEKTKVKSLRLKGGKVKTITLQSEVINILDPKTNKYTKAKLNSVKESNANRNYIRRNIITKGTIVDTDKGKAKITSRPGQEGSINGILIE